MDGYVLSETGHKEIKKLLPEPQKKSRGKRSQATDEPMNEDTNSLDASDSKKRRSRTNKIGIGGFLVKQRNRKEDDTNSNNTSFDLNETDGDPVAPVSEEKRKRKRNKAKKNPLLNTYPPQLQDAFFGKGLLEARKENAMDALDEPVGTQRFVKFSKDQIVSLMSTVEPSKTHPAGDSKLSVGLPNETPELNKVFDEDDDSLRDILSFHPELPEEEELMNMFQDMESEPMDAKDDALDHLTLAGQPVNQSQQEFSFLHQQSQLSGSVPSGGSVPQQPQQNSIHSISNKSIMEGSSFSNDSFSSTSSSFTSHNQSSGNLTASNQNSNSSEAPDGESLTQGQKHSAKWKEDEPLDEMATISPVLYANLVHKHLRVEFPNWNDRFKQISKLWRLLKPDERQTYLNKARENRAANRVQKDQIKQSNKDSLAASIPVCKSESGYDLQSTSTVASMQTGGMPDSYPPNGQQPMNRPPICHQISGPPFAQQPPIQVPVQVSRVRVRPPIDPNRISLPNANKVQSPRSQNQQDTFTNQFTTNSPFSPKPLNEAASPSPYSHPPAAARQHSAQSPVGSFSPAHNSLSNEPFPSSPARPMVGRQDSGPLTPNSDLSSPYSRQVPTTPILGTSQDACSNTNADLYAQQPMTPTIDSRPPGIRPPSAAMSAMDPYARPPHTPRPSHDAFSFHSPVTAGNRGQQQFNANQRSPSSFSPQMQSNSPDPYAQQPMTPMPAGYDPYKQQNKPMTSNLNQPMNQQLNQPLNQPLNQQPQPDGQPADAKRQLRDLLQKNQQQQQQQCFRSPFPVDQMNSARHRIVNPSNDQQVFRHPGDNLNANRMMPPRGPMTMDVRKVIGQQQQHIRYPPQQMSPSPGMPPQQPCSPMSSNWNRMPAMQQPQQQHSNLIQQQKPPMPMQNAYQQPFNQPQQQFMPNHNSQMIYGGGQQSHLQNALQHPMKANDPNMSTAAINQPIAAPNTTTSELIKQVQESDPLGDDALMPDDVLGNEEDLLDFDEDFNILEYADPDIDSKAGKVGGQKSSIFDEGFDELLDKEEELDKEKPKDGLEGPSTSGSSHLPPPYSAAIQQQQSSIGQRKNTDDDLMNLLSNSDFEKMKSDLFDGQMSSPTGKSLSDFNFLFFKFN